MLLEYQIESADCDEDFAMLTSAAADLELSFVYSILVSKSVVSGSGDLKDAAKACEDKMASLFANMKATNFESRSITETSQVTLPIYFVSRRLCERVTVYTKCILIFLQPHSRSCGKSGSN